MEKQQSDFKELGDKIIKLCSEQGLRPKEAADFLSTNLQIQLYMMPDRLAAPLLNEISSMPLTELLEKESAIREICSQATEALRLLRA